MGVAANAFVCGNAFPMPKPGARTRRLDRFVDAHSFDCDPDAGHTSDTGVQSMMSVTGGKRDG
jgi:hypothetical protein